MSSDQYEMHKHNKKQKQLKQKQKQHNKKQKQHKKHKQHRQHAVACNVKQHVAQDVFNNVRSSPDLSLNEMLALHCKNSWFETEKLKICKKKQESWK